MYHKVGIPVHHKADRFLNVSVAGFRRHLRILTELGFRARPFQDVVEAHRSGKSLPSRTFAVTFDDGFQCVGEYAAPVLAEFGFPATIFVVSDAAGKTNIWDVLEGHAEQPLLDWEALRRLVGAGWEIGGHTRTHPRLDTLDDGAALAEIVQGKEEIEARLGLSPQTFCYPYGYFNSCTPRLVDTAGFLGACTVRSGLATPQHDPFLLPRVKLGYGDGALRLLFKLLVRPHLPNTRPFRRSHRLRIPDAK